MGKREADFSNTVKLTIAYRCNYKCSNPNCRVDTMRKKDDDQMYSIGRAAHIEAASAGGPRYNPESALEYRKSIENAIWLCPTCADIIDKDENAYPTSLLKAWKYKAEERTEIKGVRIFAVANDAGGVGNSSVTAYLAQAFAAITSEPVLCISMKAGDYVGAMLSKKRESSIYSQKAEIISLQKNIDYMCDYAFEDLLIKDTSIYKKELLKIIKEGGYKFVIIDCGNQSLRNTGIVTEIATDLIVPIGDHVRTDNGIIRLIDYLAYRESEINVWPIFSKGLTLSNKWYSRQWFKGVSTAFNQMKKLEYVTIHNTGIIIPNSSYVDGVVDVFDSKKTEHVAAAYLEFVEALLE